MDNAAQSSMSASPVEYGTTLDRRPRTCWTVSSSNFKTAGRHPWRCRRTDRSLRAPPVHRRGWLDRPRCLSSLLPLTPSKRLLSTAILAHELARPTLFHSVHLLLRIRPVSTLIWDQHSRKEARRGQRTVRCRRRRPLASRLSGATPAAPGCQQPSYLGTFRGVQLYKRGSGSACADRRREPLPTCCPSRPRPRANLGWLRVAATKWGSGTRAPAPGRGSWWCERAAPDSAHRRSHPGRLARLQARELRPSLCRGTQPRPRHARSDHLAIKRGQRQRFAS